MLSGGQRQAVAIARSLLGEPKVVMLDEPTAALGIVQTEQILRLIERLRERGLGVIVISHNLADVFEVADRIAVLRLGRMAAVFETARPATRRSSAAITGAEFGTEERPTEESARCEARSSERAPVEARRREQLLARAGAAQRLARGELGSVRVLLGIAVIWTIFQLANDRFLSAVNLSNLTLQIAAVATISIGVVLVLLLGEIDLSVGAVSGLAASVMAVLSVKNGWSPELAIVAGLLVGTAIGLFNGFMVTVFGIPSFVVTLAGLLGLAGRAVARARRHRLDQPAAEHDHRPHRHLLRPGRRLGARDRRDRRLRGQPLIRGDGAPRCGGARDGADARHHRSGSPWSPRRSSRRC